MTDKVFQTISSLKSFLSLNSAEWSFIPTMGALHAGHCSLLKKSLADGHTHHIVSIFVNPTQFAANEDLSSYPRQLQQDIDMIQAIDSKAIFFTPEVSELYPCEYRNLVHPPVEMNTVACGTSRPTHFQGVLTVLTKLINIIQPEYMYMGKKDYQQLQIVKNMCRDFFFKTKVIGVDTVRQSNGLALSSRNTYLTPPQFEAAPLLRQALVQLKDDWINGKPITALKKTFSQDLLNAFEVDYLEVLDQKNLQSTNLSDKHCIALAAAYLGKTRLIDNIELPPRKHSDEASNA